jgi:hypothetical protein
MATEGAPSARSGHAAVWTGHEVIVWGGVREEGNDARYFGDGAAYDPEIECWRTISIDGAPTPRAYARMVWTGTEVIVWSGRDAEGGGLSTGARYVPGTDVWVPMSGEGAPPHGGDYQVAWTGQSMLVWGFTDDGPQAPFAATFDPTTGAWFSLSVSGAPAAASIDIAWTSQGLFVLGDWIGEDVAFSYDPDAQALSPLMVPLEPVHAVARTVTVAGERMIAFGGYASGEIRRYGGSYRSNHGEWDLVVAPSGRRDHTSVWTGTELLVWGGLDRIGHLADEGLSYR